MIANAYRSSASIATYRRSVLCIGIGTMHRYATREYHGRVNETKKCAAHSVLFDNELCNLPTLV